MTYSVCFIVLCMQIFLHYRSSMVTVFICPNPHCIYCALDTGRGRTSHDNGFMNLVSMSYVVSRVFPLVLVSVNEQTLTELYVLSCSWQYYAHTKSRLEYDRWSCVCIVIPIVGNPSCLQTTIASSVSHRSSQTGLQSASLHISTAPIVPLGCPVRRTSPSMQTSEVNANKKHKMKVSISAI